MPELMIFAILVFESLTIGGLFFAYPRIARRGLLFGVYVGEQKWESAEAQRVVHGWETGIAISTAVTLIMGIAAFLMSAAPVLMIAAMLLLPVAGVGLYLRAYFRARVLGVAGAPPAAVAFLTAGERSSRLPILVLAAGVLGGIIALAYCADQYANLPDVVPTHFGPSGLPDAWRPKSFWTVMLMPLMTLILSAGMGGVVYFTSTAKRALRYPHVQLSAQAQHTFRRAVTRFLSAVSLLVTFMLTAGSIASVRVGLGLAPGLPPWTLGIAIALGITALGGTVWLVWRYGQGGARLERGAGDAPLTDGLADNRNWVLGMFYYNRDDPSIFVERRFGFGYTINFGNWKAVAFFAAFIGLILLSTLMAVIKT